MEGIGKDAFVAIACEMVAAGQDEAGVKVRLSQESGITVGDNPAVGVPSSVGRAALCISSLTKCESVRNRRLIRSRQAVLVGLGNVLPCKLYFLLSSYPYVFINPSRAFVAMRPETRWLSRRFAGFRVPNACYHGLTMLSLASQACSIPLPQLATSEPTGAR